MEVDDSTASSSKDSAPVDNNDSASRTSFPASSVAQEFYDDIYFDSDENEDDDDGVDASNPSQQSQSASASNFNKDRIQRTIEENEQRLKAEEKKEKKNKKKHPVLTNDELFYDPDMDDEDQKWVDDRRRNNFFPIEASTSGAKSETKKKETPVGGPSHSDTAVNGDAAIEDAGKDTNAQKKGKNR